MYISYQLEQHQKFWKKKNPQLQPPLHQDPPLQLQNKQLQKTNKTTQSINIQHLTQLLQHQINKINLVITKNTPTNSTTQYNENTDSMIIDQIIKIVDTIKDIVLQLKRKITLDHIRCILKGKDINQGKSIPFNSTTPPPKPKIGLIQFTLKHAKNQLAAIHTIKTILTIFLNSQCNYSSQSFQKILSQLQPSDLTLNSHQFHLCKINKQYRQLYFKLIKQYIISKQHHHHIHKKININQLFINQIIHSQLISIYQKWIQKQQKNKSFKFKDDHKQWMLVIQNPNKNQQQKPNPAVYQKKYTTIIQPCNKNIIDQQNIYTQQQTDNIIKNPLQYNKTKQNQIYHYQKKYKSKTLQISLDNQKNQQYSKYFLKIFSTHLSYKNCIELIKYQKNWNTLLIDTQFDLYSNTKKQRYKIPGKQQKIFRFIEVEDISMNLEDQQLENQLNFQQCSHITNQQDSHQPNNNQTKRSMQTTQSITTTCSDQPHSDTIPVPCPSLSSSFPSQPLSCSQLSHKIAYIKSPPCEGKFNSFTQKIKIQKIKPLTNLITPCLIQIQIYLTQPSSIKFFNSQIQCTTTYIWDGIINLFTKTQPNNRTI